METAAQILDYVNLGLFSLVALAALWLWRQGRGRAALWAALTFSALALAVDAGAVLPEEPMTDLEWLGRRSLIAVLVLFPYLLYRFTTTLEPPTRRLERFLGFMTVVVLAWTFLLPDIPQESEPQTPGFIAYLGAFLVHWTVLTLVVSVRLWRAGRGQPSVARRRMRLLSAASAAITVALLVGAASPDDGSVASLAANLLATVSALAFLVGLAPPAPLRLLWRTPETRRVQQAVTELMTAQSEREVAGRVLEPVASIVGANAAALLDADGRILGTHGTSIEDVAAVLETGRGSADERSEVYRLDFPAGSLLVWRSPYAPFFGEHELALLGTLGSLTDLALDRARLLSHERQTRRALERANEVKANFVALAAHELRTPVATIDGIIQTLYTRGDRLAEHDRRTLERTLQQQSTHMRVLVDQLLDLSRLEAEAVRIDPLRIPVRERVEAVVATAAGERTADVRIDVDDSVEVVADGTAFDRIVSNLVVNALRYGEPPVIVRAEQQDRHFRLAVEDRGPGVAPEFVPSLFERFTRSGRSRAVTGTGLGLAIARSYATAHGGDLRYEPAQPSGARFQLVLPVEGKRNGGATA